MRFGLVLLGACGFSGPGVNGSLPVTLDGAVDDSTMPVLIDAPAPAVCPWQYSPTNVTVDPCTLGITAVPVVQSATTVSLDFGTQGMVVEGVRIVRVDQLAVHGTLNLSGPAPLILLVDGAILIDGLVDASAGANSTGCTALIGNNGSDSTDGTLDPGGGGGGAGGAGAANSGDGGDGSGAHHGNKGTKRNGSASTLEPLRSGCPGGHGGSVLGQAGGAGGDGGGGLQLSGASTIQIAGVIRAPGRAGRISGVFRAGAGGGGGGGALLFEGTQVVVRGTLCADGASGGGGGGDLSFGTNGRDGQCTGDPTPPDDNGNNGGAGGPGGARTHTTGDNALNAASSSGGGGGGGGVGWIRIHDLGGAHDTTGATITPAANFN